MYCPECGTQLPDDAAYCSNCGVSLSDRGPEKSQSETGTERERAVTERAPSEGTPESEQERPPSRPPRDVVPGAEGETQSGGTAPSATQGPPEPIQGQTTTVHVNSRKYLGRFGGLSYALAGFGILSFLLLLGFSRTLPATSGPYQTGMTSFLAVGLAIISLVFAGIYIAIGYTVKRGSRLGWWVGMLWFGLMGLVSFTSIVGLVLHALGLYWGYRGRHAFD